LRGVQLQPPRRRGRPQQQFVALSLAAVRHRARST